MDKNDYLKGWIYFIGAIVSIASFFTTPVGETLFHEFLGLFGIAPGIPFGETGMIFIFMIIPLVSAIFCVKKVLKFWHSYGVRFREYAPVVRFLPVIILVALFWANSLTPSVVDRAYFFMRGAQGGLRAITVYAVNDNIMFETDRDGNRTYTYSFIFNNHSRRGSQWFHVAISYYSFYRHRSDVHEVFIVDEYGFKKVFLVGSGRNEFHFGEFTVLDELNRGSSGNSTITAVRLVNNEEEHFASMLVRRAC